MCYKQLSILVISLLLLQNGVSGWIALFKHEPQTVVPEGAHCHTTHKNIGSLSLKEERRLLDECANAECLENRDVLIRGCAPVQAMPPCYILPGNLSKPFPDCCYETKCYDVAIDFEGNKISDSAE